MSNLSRDGWWRASDGQWYPPESHPDHRPPPPPPPPSPPPGARPYRPPSALRIVLFCVLGIAALSVCASVAGRSGSSAAGTLSAGACLDVVEASSERAVGLRTEESYRSALRKAESDARRATSMDAKYRPILEAIVTRDITYLRYECGDLRPKG